MSSFTYRDNRNLANITSETNLGDAIGTQTTRTQSMAASFTDTFEDIVGAYWGNYEYWRLGQQGDAMITEEEANQLNEEYGTVFDFNVDKETKSQGVYRLNRFLQDGINEARINKAFPVSNFLSALPAEFVEPTNYIPLGLGLKALKKAKAVTGLVTKKGKIDKLTAAINRGQKYKAAYYAGRNYLGQSLAWNTVVQPFYEVDRVLQGDEFNLGGSAYEIMMSTMVGTGLFSPINMTMAFRRGGKNERLAESFHQIYNFMETGEFGKAGSVMYKVNPEFRKAVKQADELADFIENAAQTDGVIRFENLSNVQLKTLEGLLNQHGNQQLETAITKQISDEIVNNAKDEAELNPVTKSDKYKTMFINVRSSILGRKAFSSLSEAEQNVAQRVLDKNDTYFIDRDKDGAPTVLHANDTQAQAKIETFNAYLDNLMNEHKIYSIQGLADAGVISKRERAVLLKRYRKTYEKAYAYETRLATMVIDSIFGRQVKFNRLDADQRSLGSFRGEADTVNIASVERIVLSERESPFSILFHEAMHNLEQVDPLAYAQLDSIISKHSQLEERLDFMSEKYGYRPEARRQERVPAMIEWALTTEEFWNTLFKENKSLFSKLKLALMKLVSDMSRKYSDSTRADYISTKKIAELTNSKATPAKIATEFAQILNESKKRSMKDFKISNAIATHRANVARVGQFDEPGSTDKTGSGAFIRDNFTEDGKIANNELRSTRTKSFLTELENYLPAEEITKLDFDGIISVLLTRRDLLNEGVDPDSTELISFDEYKATIKEVFFFLDEETFNKEHAFSDSALKQMYNVVRDFYRDEATGPTTAIPNLDIRRRIYNGESKSHVLQDTYTSRMIDIVRNDIKKYKILRELEEYKTDVEKLNFLQSMLDGRDRVTRAGKAGLEHHMIADGQQTITPLMEVLIKYNLVEVFLPEQSLSFLRSIRNKDSGVNWKMFGKNRKKQSEEFFAQLHEALVKRELPKNWKGVEALEQVYQVVSATELKILKDLNKAGILVDRLDDFGGISQKWDPDIIYSMGFDSFKLLMDSYIDKSATARRMSNVLITEGKQEIPWDFDKFMEMWYESLDPNKRTGDSTELFDLDRAFGSRNIVIKPEFATKAALEFSGYESIGHLMLAQMQRRGALAALAETAGTKPGTLLKEVAEGIKGDGARKKTSKYLYLKTVDKITGLLDSPVDASMGAFTNAGMRLSNILFLSGSGITSLTDIPNAIATLDVMGIPFKEHHQVFLDGYIEGMKRRFVRDPKGMADYFLKLSATFDILNNSVATRITDISNSRGTGFINKLNQLMFKLNGLNALTTSSEEMFVDVLTRFMKDALLEPNSVLETNLRNFGFSKAEIRELTVQIKTPDGVTRLDIDGLKPDTKRKFDRFVTKYIRQGVFRPDAGTTVMTSLGFRAGTPMGTAMRFLTQYQSFMLGMTQNIFYRMKNGISVSRPVNDVMMYKMAHFISFFAGSMVFAYISTVLKDLAKGKEPINFADMNSREMSRVFQQSGILGILEIPLDMMDYGPTEAAAPLPATLLGLLGEVGTADLTGAYKKVQDLTGDNIYGPPQWFHSYTGHYMLEFLNMIEKDFIDEAARK